MPENQTNNTGSLSEELGLAKPYDLSVTGTDRVLAVIAKKYDELSQKVHSLEKDKLLKELPLEAVKELGLHDPPPLTRRGRGYRPILAHEIIEAKKELEIKFPNGFNESMVARHMRINYFTYKKYARIYGVWKPSPNIRGKKNICDPERGKYPLSEILDGKHPDYSIFRIKQKLIGGGIKKEECERCGWKERSVLNGKVPLLMNFMDDNHKNHKLENMKLYCPNCTLVCGRGYFRSGKKYLDPDWVQQ